MDPTGRSTRVAEGRILSCGVHGEDRLMDKGRLGWLLDFWVSDGGSMGPFAGGLPPGSVGQDRPPRQVSHHSLGIPLAV